jgi:hypothetical protein
MHFKAVRVIYGKGSTPEELREYKLMGVGPVGTKKDWQEWASKNGHTVEFEEAK